MINIPSFYVLDVSHGNSAVLVDTEGIVVIDAGPRAALLDFLIANKIYEIDILLLSHADQDHIGGAIALLSSDEIKIKSVYLNPDSSKNSAMWNDLVYALCISHKERELIFEPALTTHLNGRLNKGKVNVEILAPDQYIIAKGSGSKDNKGRKLTTNSISAVIRLSLVEKPFALLPGDIDQVGLENLFENHADIQAWLLAFPHHGGGTRTGDVKEFTNILCKAVQPKIIIFSIRDNTSNFPNMHVIESIDQTLNDVAMYTTRSSELFIKYIMETESKLHKDCVGNIYLDLKNFPPEIIFE
jgi:beta-lactamase superfamily II metal-dependent hydrolase